MDCQFLQRSAAGCRAAMPVNQANISEFPLVLLVGVRGFEPLAPASRTQMAAASAMAAAKLVPRRPGFTETPRQHTGNRGLNSQAIDRLRARSLELGNRRVAVPRFNDFDQLVSARPVPHAEPAQVFEGLRSCCRLGASPAPARETPGQIPCQSPAVRTGNADLAGGKSLCLNCANPGGGVPRLGPFFRVTLGLFGSCRDCSASARQANP